MGSVMGGGAGRAAKEECCVHSVAHSPFCGAVCVCQVVCCHCFDYYFISYPGAYHCFSVVLGVWARCLEPSLRPGTHWGTKETGDEHWDQ